MKNLIITDSHSKNPVDFIKRRIDEGIERLYFLGDCDFPEILEQIFALPIDNVVLPGNHEYGFSRGEVIDSSALINTPAFYIKIWEDSRMREFVLNSKNHLAERIILGERVVFCHGCFYALETSNPILEGRLASPLYSGNIHYNLNEMREENYWILFRGHDHMPEILSFPKQANPFSASAKREHRAVTFSRDSLYIVTVGSFLDGNYGILDDEKMALELKSNYF